MQPSYTFNSFPSNLEVAQAFIAANSATLPAAITTSTFIVDNVYTTGTNETNGEYFFNAHIQGTVSYSGKTIVGSLSDFEFKISPRNLQ
jgi:7,8-dihydro-6-hydroxymethylpterin-pyrophosphokinase